MVAIKENMVHFWHGLNVRERRTFSLGAGILLAGLGYAYLWLPLAQDRARLQVSVPLLRIQAALLQTEKAEVLRLRPMVIEVPVTQVGLQQALEQSASAAMRQSITGIVLESSDRATLTLNSVDFDDWVAWVALLHHQQHIRIESATVESLRQNGMVKIHAVMVRT